jgi:acetylornithine deacetylase/succinyl-diaminopimelate desuccinylase-like protein
MTTPDDGSAVRRLEAEALEFTRQLIRIESVNTGSLAPIGDGEARAARLVQEWLAEVGIEGEFVEPHPGRGSFVARIPGTDPAAPALLAHSHLDVVPVDARDWTAPPFGAEVRDGMLIGRGAVDMKHFAGTLVAVARHFARVGVRPRRDLVLAFLADEEAGGVWGSRWLVRNRPELFEGVTESISEVGGFSVPLDASGRRAYLLATGEKGPATVALTANGSARHASGLSTENSVVALAEAVARIGAYEFPVARTRTLEAFLEAFGRARGRPFDEATLEADLAGLEIAGPLVGAGIRTTATPTVLTAGGKPNVVPARASALVDVRVIPGQDELVRATLRELAGPDIEVEERAWYRGTKSPASGPFVDVLRAAIAVEDAQGEVVPYMLPASTDNKHFSKLGIAGYGFTPLRVPLDFDVFAQFHAADERVPVEALEFGARVTASILKRA